MPDKGKQIANKSDIVGCILLIFRVWINFHFIDTHDSSRFRFNEDHFERHLQKASALLERKLFPSVVSDIFHF